MHTVERIGAIRGFREDCSPGVTSPHTAHSRSLGCTKEIIWVKIEKKNSEKDRPVSGSLLKQLHMFRPGVNSMRLICVTNFT